MAPPRGTKLTDAQKADADLWLHKIAKMEFDGTNKNLVAGDIHSMANDGISATEELKVKTGTYQGGEFGLGKNITGSFSCPNGFTISMFIKADDLNTGGDMALFDMGMDNSHDFKKRHYLRFFLGGKNGKLGSQYLGIAGGTNPTRVGRYGGQKFQIWDTEKSNLAEFLLTVTWHYKEERTKKDTYSANSDGYISIFINGDFKVGAEFKNGEPIRPFEQVVSSRYNLRAAAIPWRIGGQGGTGADDYRNYDNSADGTFRILKGWIREFRFYGIPWNDTKVKTLYSGLAGPFPPTVTNFTITVDEDSAAATYQLSQKATKKTFNITKYTIDTSSAAGKGTINLDESSGEFTFQPAENFSGSFKLNFYAYGPGTGLPEGKSTLPGEITINVTPVNDPPSGSVIIAGNEEVGEKLTAATVGVNDPEGINGNFQYTWKDQNNNILKATSASHEYTIGGGAANKKIHVTISYTDNANNQETIVSGLTGTIQAAALDNADITAINNFTNSNKNSWRNALKIAIQKGVNTADKRRKRHRFIKTTFARGLGNSFAVAKADLVNVQMRYDAVTIQKVDSSKIFSPGLKRGVYVAITDVGEKAHFLSQKGAVITVEVTSKANSTNNAQYKIKANNVLIKSGLSDGESFRYYDDIIHLGGAGIDGVEYARSVAKADVAELTAALDSTVSKEKAHHLIVVATNKVLSTTQFKQMFYSRGDDFFQIANAYECPDSKDSVYSSVWGIDCQDPWDVNSSNATGLLEMGHRLNATRRLTSGNADQSQTSIQTQECYNFNKLGGRENDPSGVAWAYSYAHDQNRNFYAQYEVMGYLEKDTCVKRDFWTACSRMSIEDQLYGLAFASETDQDLCMQVTCARRWSEVEDALAESCTAANNTIENVLVSTTFVMSAVNDFAQGAQQGMTVELGGPGGTTVFQWLYPVGPNLTNGADMAAAINADIAAGLVKLGEGASVSTFVGTGSGNAQNGGSNYLTFTVTRRTTLNNTGATPDYVSTTGGLSSDNIYGTLQLVDGGHVDLYINVRVSNGHPKALDTILRCRFTVAYAFHEPSALNTWNIRSSKAAMGVIQSGVVGDAPEGGKEQAEDTTVVVP